jgi:predicted transcriptional regulator
MQKLTYQDLNVLDQDRDLSAGVVRFMHHLVRIECGRLSWFKMSHAYMATVANVSRSTVKRYISQLIAAGYLVKRLNAAVVGGIKVRIASSYRFVRPAATREGRKMRSLMQVATHVRKGLQQFALWSTRKRVEAEQNITTPDSGEDERNRPMQSAYEAMLLDRQRRRERST